VFLLPFLHKVLGTSQLSAKVITNIETVLCLSNAILSNQVS